MTDGISNNSTADISHIEINFQTQLEVRAQQMMAATREFVTYMDGKGEENKITVFGKPRLQERTQRHAVYPTQETPRDSYWFTTRHFWGKEHVSSLDQLFEMMDPQGTLVQQWAAAAAREVDRIHLNNAIGMASRGRYQTTGRVQEALPSSQIIPHGNTGLTTAKLRNAVNKIRRAHPDPSGTGMMDPIVTFCTDFQITNDLMSENNVVSNDFNVGKPLNNLTLPFWAGTFFKKVEDVTDYHPENSANRIEFDPIIPLDVDGIGSGQHIRRVVMWAKSAMRGKTDRPIITRTHDESKDRGVDARSVTVDMSEGSTRFNPLGVVVIECLDTQPLSLTA